MYNTTPTHNTRKNITAHDGWSASTKPNFEQNECFITENYCFAYTFYSMFIDIGFHHFISIQEIFNKKSITIIVKRIFEKKYDVFLVGEAEGGVDVSPEEGKIGEPTDTEGESSLRTD